MSTNDTVFMYCGDSYSGGMPYTFKAEDLDSWPNGKANAEVMATITEILKQGYQGVVVEDHRLTDGRVISKFFTNPDTPEGRMVPTLLQLAKVGKSLPLKDSITILENAYRLNDLALPSRSGSAN